MTNPITQRTFIRGLDASTSKFDQPKGSLPRLSNLLFTRRGSLITVDGASVAGGVADPISGEIVAVIEYLKYGAGFNGAPLLFLQDPNTDGSEALTEVGSLTAVPAAGGAIPDGTYDIVVQVNDGRNPLGVGTPGSSNGVFITGIVLGGGNNTISISWLLVPGAASYNVWLIDTGGVNPGQPRNLDGSSSPMALIYQPDFNQPMIGVMVSTTLSAYGLPAISTNIGLGNQTIGALKLMIMYPTGPTTYLPPFQLGYFPARNLTYPSVTASGGVLGSSGPVPQLLQFAGYILIGLGNGVRPQYTDGVFVKPLTNTFTAQYINWMASTTYLVDDIVQPSPPDGHIYKAVQGGATGSSQPAFNSGTGQQTLDNQVLWQENGQVTTSPPPRGGAHLAYHTGSLWIMDTSPVNSSDLLDGPSAIAMSDVDNILSWNPLNRAFIGKDDGSDGMGLSPLTISEVGIAPLGSLISFKDFSTYQIIGVFGAPDFAIQQLQTDMGCLAPRSIKFISGFGIIRMAHAGFALTDGVRDRLISEPIRPFIFGSPSTGSPGQPAIIGIDQSNIRLIKADLINNPPMYAAAAPLIGSNGALNRIFIYDLVLKAWGIIDLPSTTSPTSYISSIYQRRATDSVFPKTVVGGFDNGVVQTIQNGDAAWYNGLSTTPVSWTFTTPEVFNGQDQSAPIYIDTMTIRGINVDGQPLTVTVNLQTETGYVADPRVYPIGPGEFEVRIGIAEIVLSCNATVSGSGRVEIESLTWNVLPQPSDVPAVIT